MLPLAFFWSSDTQCLAFWKDSAFVMSYTTAAAEAPLRHTGIRAKVATSRCGSRRGLACSHHVASRQRQTCSTEEQAKHSAPVQLCPCGI